MVFNFSNGIIVFQLYVETCLLLSQRWEKMKKIYLRTTKTPPYGRVHINEKIKNLLPVLFC